MELAGIRVDRVAVLELAERLVHAGHLDTAALLLGADGRGVERVTLDERDIEAVIDVRGETPDTLAELYSVLVFEHRYRALDGIA